MTQNERLQYLTDKIDALYEQMYMEMAEAEDPYQINRPEREQVIDYYRNEIMKIKEELEEFYSQKKSLLL